MRRLGRRDALASLTDLDRRPLTLLAEQRVLTQTQLERLLADTPARTLRYRTERLTRHGLVGRSRPYRDRGSAPFHYWPTRASDAFVRGEPVPRGGERSEPNPQFLHHAERLSELYVLLQVQAPTVGLHLHAFRREGEAREVFRAEGRERALAPDALVHLHDDKGRGLLAFVELDMGTMSHARLKTKAAGYAAYAAQAAWTERHPFCPCLLFLTTTETRALSFLKMLTALLERRGGGSYYGRRRGYLDWFAAAACAHARDPERAFSERCWDDLTLAGGGLTLTDCLNKALVAYDATRAKEEAEQRTRDAQRERLRAKPEARRAHLQEKRLRFHGEHLAQFGEAAATALSLLLNASEPMNDLERDAFAALARQLDDDPLEAQAAPEPVPPTWTDTQAVARLVDVYRRRQRARVEDLAHRYGEGPALRRDRQQLANDGLLGSYSWDSLQERAKRDQAARQEQEQRRVAYLARRDREARQRKHEAGLAARLAHGRAAVYAIVDRDRLRICKRCDEIAYPPEPERHGTVRFEDRHQPTRCHFCGASELDPWDTAYESELEYGPGKRLLGSDLTSGGIDGLMDDHDNGGGRL
ncbi:MAG TPA: replication-relaxation family protein [Gaiellaceae bacterium]|nr:replication-relaxation family protein [Gaiellaceae bacterium]